MVNQNLRMISYSDVRRRLKSWDVPEETIEEFVRHYAECPLIWKQFERFTLDAITKGRVVGAKAVMERVRWESEIEKGIEWKCNNNFVSYYGRVFALKYPEHSDYFEFRQVKGLKAV